VLSVRPNHTGALLIPAAPYYRFLVYSFRLLTAPRPKMSAWQQVLQMARPRQGPSYRVAPGEQRRLDQLRAAGGAGTTVVRQ